MEKSDGRRQEIFLLARCSSGSSSFPCLLLWLWPRTPPRSPARRWRSLTASAWDPRRWPTGAQREPRWGRGGGGDACRQEEGRRKEMQEGKEMQGKGKGERKGKEVQEGKEMQGKGK